MIDKIIMDGLAFAFPLFIMAVGGIYSEKSGITMLALEGIQGFGAFTGAVIFTLLQPILSEGAHGLVYIAILMSMIGGMLCAWLHAVLSIRFRVNQVVSGVVVNILAMSLTTFLTGLLNEHLTGEPSNKIWLGAAPRFSIPGLSKIPVLGAFFRDIYLFVPFIVLFTAVAGVVLYKTAFGLRLRACGDNPESLDAAGGNVSRTRYVALTVTGLLTGLGGLFFAFSFSANFSPMIYMGYGYLAIAAMIFGNWDIGRTLAACLFFGFARSTGYQMILKLGMSSDLSDLFLMIPYVLTLLLLTFFSRHNRPPRALGVPYDHESR
ncbi:MAG: ABC transporter permease [Clostridiales bacterium]|mgnify:FL=1|jgi:simple sugar transport system permease protein|nr:ABC transporter permease [Clostridiales bacterium]MCK9350166.1 ABC transporter permease [Clostridiales bacterium]